ncbi:MAG TPA: hypothetical protein VES19_17345 [Candidatus Limnocylindrales bacterium]|nr:hypothetical protein [Candidatus Limnocylindrales bacterium]
MFPAFHEVSRVELTLYTDTLITRGWVRTRQHRVTDILNHATDPFLILEEVTVEELGDRGAPIRADIAQINLDSVLFAVADVPVEPSPELRTPKKPAEAIVSVPPFRITGTIHLLPGEPTLREALHELTGRFLPVTNATYWSDRLGEARKTSLLVAVNHQRTQILAQHKVVDPWAGLGAPAPSARPPDDTLRG